MAGYYRLTGCAWWSTSHPMPTAKDPFAEIISRFVAEIRQAAQAEARASLIAALTNGQQAAPAATPQARLVSPKAKSKGRPPSKQAAGKASSQRNRRSPAQLEATRHRVLEHVKKHAGQRSEDIRAALRLSKQEWLAAVTALLDTKQLTKQGDRRATTYSAR